MDLQLILWTIKNLLCFKLRELWGPARLSREWTKSKHQANYSPSSLLCSTSEENGEGVCSTNSLPSFLPTWGVLVYFLPCFLFCKWLKSSSRGSSAAVFQKDYWTKNLSNICFTSPTMQWWILSICRCLYFSFPFWWLCSKHWHLDTSILSLPPLKRGTKFPVPSRELSLPCTKLAMSSLLFSSLTWDLVDIFLFGLEWVSSWSWPWLCGARLL